MNGNEEQLSKSVQNPMDNTESDMSYSEYDTHKSDNDQEDRSDAQAGAAKRRQSFFLMQKQKDQEDDDSSIQWSPVSRRQRLEFVDQQQQQQQLQQQSFNLNLENEHLQTDNNNYNNTNTTQLIPNNNNHDMIQNNIQRVNREDPSVIGNYNNHLMSESSNEIRVSLNPYGGSPKKKDKGTHPRITQLVPTILHRGSMLDEFNQDSSILNNNNINGHRLSSVNQDASKYLMDESHTANQRHPSIFLSDQVIQQGLLRNINNNINTSQEYTTNQNGLGNESIIGQQEQFQQSKYCQSQFLNPQGEQQPVGLSGVWKHSSLLIITLVKKFQNMLMSHNNQNKFRALDKQHFEVIGDKSVYQPYYLKYLVAQDILYKKKMNNNKLINTTGLNRQNSQAPGGAIGMFQSIINFTFFSNVIIKLLRNFSVLMPNSKTKIAWNILLFLLLLANFFTIPLKVTFSNFSTGQGRLNELTYVSSVFFLLDMLLNFNSAYFSKGLIITERIKIIHSYVKKNLFFDLITLLAYLFTFFSTYQLEAGVLIKILKLAPLIENFEEILNLKQRGQAILSLLKLVMFIVMVTHILGCSFFLFARVEQIYFPESTNWIQVKNFWEAEWYDQYILSLYWSVVTMITVGYGDITPVNMQERLFVIIVMLISCGVFAYSINSIGRILEELSKRDALFRDSISLVTSYLKQRGISYDLQLRIRKYFQYLHRENIDDNEKSEGLMDMLPSSLKNELGTEMYVKIINDQKIFKLNYSQKFIQELSLKMKEKRFGPEEIVFQEKDLIDKLYFIIKGQVQLFVNVRDSHNASFTSVSILTKGRLIGSGAFFTQLPCSSGARCLNVTSLVYISREDFVEVIKKHPKDYEKFCMLRDNLQINGISRGLGTKCHLCGSFNHSFQQCHLVRYNPMKEKIILRYNKTEQGRDPAFKRNKRHPTSSARVAHELLKDIAIALLVDMTPEDNDNDDDASVLEVIENIREYYTKEEKKWKNYVNINDINDTTEDPSRKKQTLSSNPLDPCNNDVPSGFFSENADKQQSAISNDTVIQDMPVIPPVVMIQRKRVPSGSDLSSRELLQNNNNNFNGNALNKMKRKMAFESADSPESQSATQNQLSQNHPINSLSGIPPISPSDNHHSTSKSRKNYSTFKTTSLKQDDQQSNVQSDIQSSFHPTSAIRARQLLRKKGNVLLGIENQDELIQKLCFSNLEDLDKMQIYEIYFIDGNVNRILDNYNNNFIHIKYKEDFDLLTKKRHIKRLMTKKRRQSKQDRLQTLIIQKRSQNSKPGTHVTTNVLNDSPLQSEQIFNKTFNFDKAVLDSCLEESPYKGKPPNKALSCNVKPFSQRPSLSPMNDEINNILFNSQGSKKTILSDKVL